MLLAGGRAPSQPFDSCRVAPQRAVPPARSLEAEGAALDRGDPLRRAVGRVRLSRHRAGAPYPLHVSSCRATRQGFVARERARVQAFVKGTVPIDKNLTLCR